MIPVRLPFKLEVLQVSCGFEHSLILGQDHRVYGFGKNQHGQLGLSDLAKYLAKPSILEVIGDVKYVKAGIMGSYLVTKEGKLYSTGSNKKGEIGQTQEVAKISKFTLIDTSERVRKVESGLRHAVLWLEDGRVMGCGSNKLGQIELKELKEYNCLQLIDGIAKDYQEISCSWKNTLFLTKDGTSDIIGDNKYG